MSKGNSSLGSNSSVDLWSKIDSEYNNVSSEDTQDTSVLFVGDPGCGKSSLIQCFLKPTVTKDPKPTVALDYNFARKKVGSNSNSKAVANIWELGGDIREPKLLEFPMSLRNIDKLSIIICIDLSKPQNILTSGFKWISLVRELISRRLSELSATQGNDAVTALAEASLKPYKENLDLNKINPCEIPLFLVANKFDALKSLSLSDRRLVLQLLRFLAHANGATCLTTSATEATMRESFRNFISIVAFRGNNMKQTAEIAVEKPCYIPAGMDRFDSILLGTALPTGGKGSNDGEANATVSSVKSRLASSDSDMAAYLTNNGLTKSCYLKLYEHSTAAFGVAENAEDGIFSGTSKGSKFSDLDYETTSSTMPDNEYPEPEIDAVRIQRDMALDRYIQEVERREATLAKMNANLPNPNNNDLSSNGNSSNDMDGASDRNEEGGRDEKFSSSSSSRRSKK